MKRFILLTVATFISGFVCFAQTEVKEPKPKLSHVVHEAVEIMPKYVGGEEAMVKFLAKNIEYPKKAKENDITGIVYISFVIDQEGYVTDAKIERDIGGGCGAAALKVVNMMPKWKPGYNGGNPVRVMYTLPVSFESSPGDNARELRRIERRRRREARRRK